MDGEKFAVIKSNLVSSPSIGKNNSVCLELLLLWLDERQFNDNQWVGVVKGKAPIGLCQSFNYWKIVNKPIVNST